MRLPINDENARRTLAGRFWYVRPLYMAPHAGTMPDDVSRLQVN